MSKISRLRLWWERRTTPVTITEEALKQDWYGMAWYGFFFLLYGFFIGMDWKKSNWGGVAIDIGFAVLFYYWTAARWAMHIKRKAALEQQSTRRKQLQDLTGQ